jgi:hypothetical protein
MVINNFKKYISWRNTIVVSIPLLIAVGLLLRLSCGVPTVSSIEGIAGTVGIPCVFHWVSGWDCPGCGLTRSVLALFFWSPHLSFYFNPLGPVLGGFVVFYWASLLSPLFKRTLLWGRTFFLKHSLSALIIVLSWGVLRNWTL